MSDKEKKQEKDKLIDKLVLDNISGGKAGADDAKTQRPCGEALQRPCGES